MVGLHNNRITAIQLFNVKCILMDANFQICCKISLECVFDGIRDGKLAFVQAMAWWREGDKPLCEPIITIFLDPNIALSCKPFSQTKWSMLLMTSSNETFSAFLALCAGEFNGHR